MHGFCSVVHYIGNNIKNTKVAIPITYVREWMTWILFGLELALFYAFFTFVFSSVPADKLPVATVVWGRVCVWGRAALKAYRGRKEPSETAIFQP